MKTDMPVIAMRMSSWNIATAQQYTNRVLLCTHANMANSSSLLPEPMFQILLISIHVTRFHLSSPTPTPAPTPTPTDLPTTHLHSQELT